MTLEQQVTSLELSKRLKELGVKQESHFFWIDAYENYKITSEAYEGWVIRPKYNAFDSISDDKRYSTYTVAELGDFLKQRGNYFEETYWKNGFRIYDKESGFFVEEMVEANARAKMLIYLIEKGLLEVNK